MSKDEDRSQQPAGEQPAFSEDGVDLTLIRWMLSLTPLERLKALESNIRALNRLRDATRRDT